MTGLLADKVAIVTGAGQGVGEGIARALADAGAAVVIAARRAENGEPAAAALRERGHEASFVRCDVPIEADVAAAIEHTIESGTGTAMALPGRYFSTGGMPTEPAP